MTTPLQVLILEDVPDDAELVALELESGGFDLHWERVDTAAGLRTALAKQPWDIILADHAMPHFNAQSALELVKAHDANIPFIIVSGTLTEDSAVQMMKAGARDFISKHNLARLVPSVRRELEEIRTAQQRKRTQEELDSLRRRNELILRAISEGVCGLDAHGSIVFINPAAIAMLGYQMNDLLGQPLSDFLLPRPSAERGAGTLMNLPRLNLPGLNLPDRDAPTARYEGLLCRKDGSCFTAEYTTTFTPEQHETISAVLVFRDISERKQQETHIQYLAQHDALTGLANRVLLHERLQQAVSSAIRHQRIGAVLMLDLDRFKNINDSMGHEAGDELLNKVVQRLLDCVRTDDTLARLGGDEFVIVLNEVEQAAAVSSIAQKVLDSLDKPFELQGQKVFLTTSLGITLFPLDDVRLERLLSNADIAMYRAKALGGNKYCFYTEQMNSEAVERAALEINLRAALKRHELLLHYQSQRDLRDGRMIGVEALLRWQHPERGLLLPASFIETAERTGAIAGIDHWVLLQSCLQCQNWQAIVPRPLPISVNFSAALLKQPKLLEKVSLVLKKAGLPAACLIMEFTERMVMEDAPAAIAMLLSLRKLSVGLAVDDFGTGYSSLSYLKVLPVGQLKIDQSFVADLANPNSAAIVKAVINLGHNLRLQVIAEGIETEWQLTALRDMGCDGGQGYYFDLPQPAEEFTQLLQQHKSLEMSIP